MPGRVLYEIAPDGSEPTAAPLAWLAETLRDPAACAALAERIDDAVRACSQVKHAARAGSLGRGLAISAVTSWATDGACDGLRSHAPLAPALRQFCETVANALAEAVAMDLGISELLAGRAAVSDDLASIVAL